MSATGPFNFNLTGLSPSTTYHFRAKGVGDGTGFGSDGTFTTSVAIPLLLVPSPASESAGTVKTVTDSDFVPNADGLVWFDINGNSVPDPNEYE